MIRSFAILGSLASTTPSLKTALEIGMEAVQYDAEGSRSAAFERYEAALQNILPILAKEQKGRRKELLHQQVRFSNECARKIESKITVSFLTHRLHYGWTEQRNSKSR